MTDNNLFQEPMATELTTKRIQARRKRRITYDCMNAIVQGIWVTCKAGHEFRRTGPKSSAGTGIGLLPVLRGMASSTCKQCEDYDEETDE